MGIRWATLFAFFAFCESRTDENPVIHDLNGSIYREDLFRFRYSVDHPISTATAVTSDGLTAVLAVQAPSIHSGAVRFINWYRWQPDRAAYTVRQIPILYPLRTSIEWEKFKKVFVCSKHAAYNLTVAPHVSTDVSGDGTTVVVGFPLQDDCHGGVWYILTNENKDVIERLNSPPTDDFLFKFMGQSVAISHDGSIIVAGAPGLDLKEGRVVVWRREGSSSESPSFVFALLLEPHGPSMSRYFGFLVAISHTQPPVLAIQDDWDRYGYEPATCGVKLVNMESTDDSAYVRLGLECVPVLPLGDDGRKTHVYAESLYFDAEGNIWRMHGSKVFYHQITKPPLTPVPSYERPFMDELSSLFQFVTAEFSPLTLHSGNIRLIAQPHQDSSDYPTVYLQYSRLMIWEGRKNQWVKFRLFEEGERSWGRSFEAETLAVSDHASSFMLITSSNVHEKVILVRAMDPHTFNSGAEPERSLEQVLEEMGSNWNLATIFIMGLVLLFIWPWDCM